MIIKQFVVTMALADDNADKFNADEMDTILYEALTDATVGAVDVREAYSFSVGIPDANQELDYDFIGEAQWQRNYEAWERLAETNVEAVRAAIRRT